MTLHNDQVIWPYTTINQSINLYIYIYIYKIAGGWYPDEPLRWNCSRLVPDSGNNFCHYFALLSIEHFLHGSLAAIYGGFFLPIDCISVDFFQLVWQGWPFLFFQCIFFPFDSDSLYIFIFELLAFFSLTVSDIIQ